MKTVSIIVRSVWDDEVGVWIASSHDIDGLAVEAETVEFLQEKVIAAITDLIELSGVDSDLPEIPIHFMAEHMTKIPNPGFKVRGWLSA